MATVLITGTSTGFGHETAVRLASRGHHVVGTMRDPRGRNASARAALEAIAARDGSRLDVLELDVTDDASVERAVSEARDRVGALDVVVNNAGVGCLGLTEAFTPEQFASVFDVNVNGAVRVNRAVLPHMRARGEGLLVHISSAAGRAVVPGLGPYCASKFALEALADAYRYELAPWGVQSVLVEPGIYRTPIFERALAPADTGRCDAFGPHGGYVSTVREVFASTMGDPSNPGSAEVADAIVALVEMRPKARPFRTIVSAPLAQLLGPYNEMAEALRPVIAGIFQVEHLVYSREERAR